MISAREEASKQDTERQGAFKPFKKTSSDGPSTSDEAALKGTQGLPVASSPSISGSSEPKKQAKASTSKKPGQGVAKGAAQTEEELAKIQRRRKQDAERKRRQRAQASETARQKEREKDAERKRQKRAQVVSSPEELKQRRKRDAERMRRKRAEATPKQKVEVRVKDAERKKQERLKKGKTEDKDAGEP
uniref:Uncharacterized protein n=1 Tax=Chloropicon laureae TaxID=464258 RepID=A0A7S2Z167_9CHLO|mmetsp:Transcript_5533/g.11781  ORF Transcript_5533/g.11781 Transcript_5533/m.11781 type:complete len:189 (+) Transcript_5533:305-871(+)